MQIAHQAISPGSNKVEPGFAQSMRLSRTGCAWLLPRGPRSIPGSVRLLQTPDLDDTGPSGLDLEVLDRSTDPCVDFYQFACGTKLYEPYYATLPPLQKIIDFAALIGDYHPSPGPGRSARTYAPIRRSSGSLSRSHPLNVPGSLRFPRRREVFGGISVGVGIGIQRKDARQTQRRKKAKSRRRYFSLPLLLYFCVPCVCLASLRQFSSHSVNPRDSTAAHHDKVRAGLAELLRAAIVANAARVSAS